MAKVELSSGLYGGGWIRVRFPGTVRPSLTCQPAPSRTSAAWLPAGTARFRHVAIAHPRHERRGGARAEGSGRDTGVGRLGEGFRIGPPFSAGVR